MKAHRVWIEIVILGTAIACVLALVIATLGVAAGAAAEDETEQSRTGSQSAAPQQDLVPATVRTYQGILTCSRCGAKHSAELDQSASKCALRCIHAGASFELVNPDFTYLLSGDVVALKPLAGQRVRVVGSLDRNTIQVHSASADI